MQLQVQQIGYPEFQTLFPEKMLLDFFLAIWSFTFH